MPPQHERTFVGSSDPSCISGHQVVWPGERAGYGAMSSSSVCQNPLVFDSWLKEFNPSNKGLSPTLSEISQKLFQVTSTETRAAPWPALSAYQAAEEPILKLPCNTSLCGYNRAEEPAPTVSRVTEKSKEPGVVRLFGVNLMKHTNSAATPDITIAGAGETSARVAGSYEGSGQLSAFSKVTKVVNESPREIQSNQSYIARNRVKVQSVFHLFPSPWSCLLTVV